MPTFLLLALALWALLHLPAYRLLRPILPRGHAVSVLLALVLAALAVLPADTRLARSVNNDALQTTLLLGGYLWVGWVFLLGCFGGIWALGQPLLARIRRTHAPSPAHLRHRGWLLVGLTTLTVALAWQEAAHPRLVTQVITTSRLAPGSAPLRVVQISDVHLGDPLLPQRQQRLVDLVASAKPDLLVSTGDFSDRGAQRALPQAQAWAAITPALGKFAVRGNHEAI
ncbi:MAG: metallophosphoesterase, partial [Magnetococcus sp. WYHC-3]